MLDTTAGIHSFIQQYHVDKQHQHDDVAGWIATLVYWVQVLYCLKSYGHINSTVLVPSTPEPSIHIIMLVLFIDMM